MTAGAASGNRFDRLEWAGAFGDLGTLIPFLVACISLLLLFGAAAAAVQDPALLETILHYGQILDASTDIAWNLCSSAFTTITSMARKYLEYSGSRSNSFSQN